jgi:hypothetical protein
VTKLEYSLQVCWGAYLSQWPRGQTEEQKHNQPLFKYTKLVYRSHSLWVSGCRWVRRQGVAKESYAQELSKNNTRTINRKTCERVSRLGLCPDTSSGNSGHVQHLVPIRRTSSIFQHHSDPIPATPVAEIATSPSLHIRLPLLPSHPLVLFTVPLSRPISIQHTYLHTPFHHSSFTLPYV